MRQVNINQLRPNLTREMDNLPFEVTKRGKVIAIVLSNVKVQEKEQDKENPNVKVQTPKHTVQRVGYVLNSDKYDSRGQFKTYFKGGEAPTRVDSPAAVKEWHRSKFDKKGKFIDYFKKS